jgi:hypothetical protein
MDRLWIYSPPAPRGHSFEIRLSGNDSLLPFWSPSKTFPLSLDVAIRQGWCHRTGPVGVAALQGFHLSKKGFVCVYKVTEWGKFGYSIANDSKT